MIRSERGVSTVEFALVAPILLVLLIGTFDIARAVHTAVLVGNGAREGARYAALRPDAAPAAITAYVASRVQPLTPTAPTLTVNASYHDGSAFQQWPGSGIPASSPAADRSVKVEVAYDWAAATTIIGRFFSTAGTRVIVAASTSMARR